MIENRLRKKTTVRSRTRVASVLLVLFISTALILLVINNNLLTSRLREITEVEVQVDRLLLQASAQIAASRANLSRYIQGFTSDADAALSDVAEATNLIEEAVALPINPEQARVLEELLVELAEYQQLISEIEAEREAGLERMAQLEAQTLQLGSDLGVRTDLLIQESEVRVEAATQAVFTSAQTRLIITLTTFSTILAFALFMSWQVQKSIIRPIEALQEGAEQFIQGNWDTTIPVFGNDELTLLTKTFNRMSTELAESQIHLEQRVAQRTQSLETSAEISHNLSSILDQDAFSIAVVEQLQATFDYYYVQLYLLDETRGLLYLKSATGFQGQKMLIRGHQVEMGQGLVGQAAVSKEIVLAPDVTQNPHWLSNPLLPETKSEAAVPIVSRDVTLGVLDIQHSVVDGISQEEVILLRSISDQVAIALSNARLFERIQQQANNEALLNRVTQRIQLADSVEQVLQVAAQELGKALNAEYTTVYLGKQKQHMNGHDKVG